MAQAVMAPAHQTTGKNSSHTQRSAHVHADVYKRQMLMNGTNGNEPGYPENALVPYPVIVVATKGAPDAMKIVLQHFSGYIARLSMRKLYDLSLIHIYGRGYAGACKAHPFQSGRCDRSGICRASHLRR